MTGIEVLSHLAKARKQVLSYDDDCDLRLRVRIFQAGTNLPGCLSCMVSPGFVCERWPLRNSGEDIYLCSGVGWTSSAARAVCKHQLRLCLYAVKVFSLQRWVPMSYLDSDQRRCQDERISILHIGIMSGYMYNGTYATAYLSVSPSRVEDHFVASKGP